MIKKLGWLLGLLLLTSCGGGSNVASNGVGSGGTGSYTSGPVSGLGSIIVNGVRYDVDEATVADDDETAGFDRSGLKLGMFVEVQGSVITAGSGAQADSAVATSVRVVSDFIGRVGIPSGSAGASITLFGHQIDIDSKTVLSEAVNPGDYVAVYGLVSATGYTATRIDKLSSPPELYKAAGVVRNLDTGQQQFDLGDHTFRYGGAISIPDGLRNGALVRVWWRQPQPLTSPIQLFKLKRAGAAVLNSNVARIRGLIAEWTNPNHFVVNGVTVDASSASKPGTLADGVRVEVEGKMVNGVLVATAVEEETQSDIDDGEVELHGRASAASLTQLTVRGVSVAYTTAVSGGVPVVDNQCIEVRGKAYNNSGQLIATRVSNDSSCRP
ncbi:MAG: DUF5666 domain-containing protein [Acidobacteriota bacterium]